MKTLVIIPARYASTRYPGKPLVEIGGKTMIQRVYEQAKKASLTEKVVVATDDERIFDHVMEFGDAVMTSPDHQSGTDRCAEAMQKIDGDFNLVVNVQGDEPFIHPSQIDALVKCFEDEKTQIATLVKHLLLEEELFNPNIVKAVFNKEQFALYFSRNPIPYLRGTEKEKWVNRAAYYKHLGLYAYRRNVLKYITQLPVSTLEKAESLEQLRWLENGLQVKTALTEHQSLAIDTPEDLFLVEKYLQNHPDSMF